MEEEASRDQEPMKKCVPDAGMPASANGCFDCNICLEFAEDPVVTLCGHLYCWPCIYRWLQQGDSTSLQQCPVCKATLSQESLVPLYGRGDSSKKTLQRLNIPHRPVVDRDAIENQSPRANEQYSSRQLHNLRQEHYEEYEHPYVNTSRDFILPSSPSGTTRVINSTAGGVLGGMVVAVLPWIFRNQEWTSGFYSGPYYVAGNGGSPRLRRQQSAIERSLNQIWVFLFCCAVLCLLMF